MDNETKSAQAQGAYAAGLKRVTTTPEPEGQKFPNGSRVKIGKMPPYMSDFPCECNATVLHTYAHAYGGSDGSGVKNYCLDIDGHGEVAWYEERQLTAIYPSGLWSRGDYVEEYERLMEMFRGVVEGSFFSDTTGYYQCDAEAMRKAKDFIANLPKEEKQLSFGDLWAGDRFKQSDGITWTKLDHRTARRHSPESIGLKDRGYKYIGDSICSFEKEDPVTFINLDTGEEKD